MSRTIRLSARNRQLQVGGGGGGGLGGWWGSYNGPFQETLKELTVQYNKEKEEEREGQGEKEECRQEENKRAQRSKTQESRASYAGRRVSR